MPGANPRRPGPRAAQPARASASRGKKHVASKHAEDRAAVLAAKMPLVHFPASARFDDWSLWPALKSRAAQGKRPAPGPFGDLRSRHVFVYGGPCCYYQKTGCIGDAVLYFAAGAEGGRKGGATPFDSGSLEDDPPRLQPFRKDKAALAKRFRFFEEHQVPLDAWRRDFERWLSFAYDDPDRYLDTQPDRYAAGEPDRLIPAYLLEHNGTRGRAQHTAGECGDRRVWTWEVRILDELPLDKVALLHVPFYSLDRALQFADQLRFRTRVPPKVEALPRAVPASYRSLYEASGGILRKLVV